MNIKSLKFIYFENFSVDSVLLIIKLFELDNNTQK